MSEFNNATICMNGHITSSYEICTDKYCSICGAENISQCQNCSAIIHGKEITSGYVSTKKYIAPLYCHNCGKPYPWTQSAIEATEMLISEDENLSEQEKKGLVGSLPDVIAETPKSTIAAVRIKKALLIAGKFTADGLRQFVIDFGCEFLVKQLGL